uniref:Uncharacterized protein n=1 Tax=Daphnia galeata TaxID=27404 RepID=A0A8J2WCV7_9CRUS|nr:unnamed protein product [Daphnia galeata]
MLARAGALISSKGHAVEPLRTRPATVAGTMVIGSIILPGRFRIHLRPGPLKDDHDRLFIIGTVDSRPSFLGLTVEPGLFTVTYQEEWKREKKGTVSLQPTYRSQRHLRLCPISFGDAVSDCSWNSILLAEGEALTRRVLGGVLLVLLTAKDG